MLMFILGLLVGQFVVLFFTLIMHKRMSKANALLANESDRYYHLTRIAYKSLNHKEQEDFENGDEVRKVNETFYSNKKSIEEGNKY